MNTIKKNSTNLEQKSKKHISGFLLKTFDILEKEEFKDIVTWNSDGSAFKVLNTLEFTEKILPNFFKHKNFASFVRQLNFYDFHKKKNLQNENEFRHPKFKKGQKELLLEITRKGNTTSVNLNGYLFKKSTPSVIVQNERHKLNEQLDKLTKNHKNMENLVQILISQNCKQQIENKALWEEIQKSKVFYEEKLDTLLRILGDKKIHETKEKKLKEQKDVFNYKKEVVPSEFNMFKAQLKYRKINEERSSNFMRSFFPSSNLRIENLKLMPEEKNINIMEK